MNNSEPEELAANPLWVLLYEEQGVLRQASIEQQQLYSEEGLVIGRKQNGNHLEIDDNSISRQHCRLFIDTDNQLNIVDLSSRNGIFVNGLQLPPETPRILNSHDKIRLADLAITIVFPKSAQNTTAHKNASPDIDEMTRVCAEEKTIIESSARQPLHKQEEEVEEAGEGQHVEHHNLLIENLMTFGARKPVISFLLVLLITLITAYGVLNLKLDTSYDSMLNRKDPNIPVYDQVIQEFGSDNLVLIYYEHDNLFSAEKIKIVDDVTYALQDLDIVEKVESLVTTLSIRNSEFGLEINQLISSPPETEEEIAIIKDNALYSPLIRGNHLSADGKKAAIIVTLRPTANEPEFNRKAYDTIEQVIKPLRAEFDNVFQIGNPRVNVEFEQGIFSDLTQITPLAVLVLVASIVLMLRTSMAAILPLITSALSIVWALGFLGYSGIPVNLLTAILPALVIVIGSTEDTHMLAAYLQGLAEDDEKQRFPAIRFMAVHVGLPIFITSFTTIIGFLANGFSDITLIKHFGISSAFGMLANLMATILVLPLLLQLFGPRKTRLSRDITTDKGLTASFVRFVERASEEHQQKIIIITSIFVVIFGFFALQVSASNDPLSFFKQDNQIINNSKALHQNLAGMQVFFVTIHATQGTDFRNPSELKKLEKVQNFMESQKIYDKIISINDYLKLVNREVHESNPDFYVIPETQELVEQYLLLFQRNDVERVLSGDGKTANFIVRHNLSDSATLNAYLAELSDNMKLILRGRNRFSLTGKNLMVNKAAESLFTSQIYSVAALIVIICILMSLLYSSITAGLVSLIPNIIPVVIMFGTMGILGIPLNPGTAIVSVIAIGIAIDDTIHILSTYNKECRIDGDQIAAARRAVKAEAIPVISTSLSLAAGFLILIASRFNIIAQFGQLSALTMVGAMFSDLLIAPVLFKRIRLVSLWDVVALNIGKRVLTESEIFESMTPFQIKRVILLSQVREYQPSEIVIQQGDVGDKLFIVIAGEAEIILHENKRKHLIARLGWGEVFGEAGYVGNAYRSATVRVAKDSKKPLQVIMLNQEQVESAMRFYPRLHARLNHNISKILARRLLERTQMNL